jgi:biopolymer transport protein ExbD
VSNTRRIRRMGRFKRHKAGLNLTSLMDVFTILVFFLLVNQAAIEVIEPPKGIVLPDSIVESKPRQTVVIFVNDDEVLVQGEVIATTASIAESGEDNIEPVRERLARIQESVIGINTQAVAESKEVTILANKAIPFHILKKIMATCTNAGYTKISLAVNQKYHQS